jgi:hypothetical protein
MKELTVNSVRLGQVRKAIKSPIIRPACFLCSFSNFREKTAISINFDIVPTLGSPTFAQIVS